MFPPQPVLENEIVRLQPLQADDFEQLYAAASDPLIWEQHPNPDRWKRDVFENYFKGAIESGGAFLMLDAPSGAVIGCTRYYDWDEKGDAVFIGYTFLTRAYWGGPHNRAAKTLLLDYAFQYFNRVLFHVGIQNMRSRKAMEKLGAKVVREVTIPYFGEPLRPNVEYEIRRGKMNDE
ncbi:MAG: GNAT family N-acetyltransferase [Saprospiraceae bacterium]|nr:GNAT family N-acetyltransferase [Saprospiraceae bacterium]